MAISLNNIAIFKNLSLILSRKVYVVYSSNPISTFMVTLPETNRSIKSKIYKVCSDLINNQINTTTSKAGTLNDEYIYKIDFGNQSEKLGRQTDIGRDKRVERTQQQVKKQDLKQRINERRQSDRQQRTSSSRGEQNIQYPSQTARNLGGRKPSERPEFQQPSQKPSTMGPSFQQSEVGRQASGRSTQATSRSGRSYESAGKEGRQRTSAQQQPATRPQPQDYQKGRGGQNVQNKKSQQDFARHKSRFSTMKFNFATSKKSLQECQDQISHAGKTRYQKESQAVEQPMQPYPPREDTIKKTDQYSSSGAQIQKQKPKPEEASSRQGPDSSWNEDVKKAFQKEKQIMDEDIQEQRHPHKRSSQRFSQEEQGRQKSRQQYPKQNVRPKNQNAGFATTKPSDMGQSKSGIINETNRAASQRVESRGPFEKKSQKPEFQSMQETEKQRQNLSSEQRTSEVDQDQQIDRRILTNWNNQSGQTNSINQDQESLEQDRIIYKGDTFMRDRDRNVNRDREMAMDQDRERLNREKDRAMGRDKGISGNKQLFSRGSQEMRGQNAKQFSGQDQRFGQRQWDKVFDDRSVGSDKAIRDQQQRRMNPQQQRFDQANRVNPQRQRGSQSNRVNARQTENKNVKFKFATMKDTSQQQNPGQQGVNKSMDRMTQKNQQQRQQKGSSLSMDQKLDMTSEASKVKQGATKDYFQDFQPNRRSNAQYSQRNWQKQWKGSQPFYADMARQGSSQGTRLDSDYKYKDQGQRITSRETPQDQRIKQQNRSRQYNRPAGYNFNQDRKGRPSYDNRRPEGSSQTTTTTDNTNLKYKFATYNKDPSNKASSSKPNPNQQNIKDQIRGSQQESSNKSFTQKVTETLKGKADEYLNVSKFFGSSQERSDKPMTEKVKEKADQMLRTDKEKKWDEKTMTEKAKDTVREKMDDMMGADKNREKPWENKSMGQEMKDTLKDTAKDMAKDRLRQKASQNVGTDSTIVDRNWINQDTANKARQTIKQKADEYLGPDTNKNWDNKSMKEQAKDTIKQKADQYLKTDSSRSINQSSSTRFNERQPTSDPFNKTYDAFNKNVSKQENRQAGIEDNRQKINQRAQQKVQSHGKYETPQTQKNQRNINPNNANQKSTGPNKPSQFKFGTQKDRRAPDVENIQQQVDRPNIGRQMGMSGQESKKQAQTSQQQGKQVKQEQQVGQRSSERQKQSKQQDINQQPGQPGQNPGRTSGQAPTDIGKNTQKDMPSYNRFSGMLKYLLSNKKKDYLV